MCMWGGGGKVGLMKIVELYVPEKGLLLNFCVAIRDNVILAQNNRVPRSWSQFLAMYDSISFTLVLMLCS